MTETSDPIQQKSARTCLRSLWPQHSTSPQQERERLGGKTTKTLNFREREREGKKKKKEKFGLFSGLWGRKTPTLLKAETAKGQGTDL